MHVKTFSYYLSCVQKLEFESLSVGNMGWGIAAWSSTALGFALLQRLAIISTAWFGWTRLTFNSEWLLAVVWLQSIVVSSIHETIDRKMFSLILCDIAASISHGNPRSAQVVLANISGLIPGSNEHDNGYGLMIPIQVNWLFACLSWPQIRELTTFRSDIPLKSIRIVESVVTYADRDAQ